MIRFDRVTKTYAGQARPALNDLSIEVASGEFVFLVGASGSGKSSFLRLVLKEEKPTRGDVHVLGRHLNALSSRKVPYFRRNLGVVFQDFRLLPGKTVFDNVAFSLQVIGKSSGFIQEAVPDVLKMVGLAGKQNRLPHELSGGEQQRVAIARAVVNRPAILLADEPTGNLDPATSAGIMQLLSTINMNGTTVVMATHDVGIVDRMQRRVIELVSGQVVRDERGGGYQTQTVPVVRRAAADADAERAANAGRREAIRFAPDVAVAPDPAAPRDDAPPRPTAAALAAEKAANETASTKPEPKKPETAAEIDETPVEVVAPAEASTPEPAPTPEAAEKPEPAPASAPAAERSVPTTTGRVAPLPLPELDDEATILRPRKRGDEGPPPLKEPGVRR